MELKSASSAVCTTSDVYHRMALIQKLK